MIRKACLVAAVGCVAVAGLNVRAEGTSTEQLTKEIAELQTQVQQLQTQQSQDQSAVAATIEQVLRDAEHRSQLMAAGDSGAGYDNGFYIRSGEFVLKPGLNFQFRNVTDYRTGIGGDKSDQIENGFEVRRLQIILEGNAFTKDLSYAFQWNTRTDNSSSTATDAGALYLEDAWVKYMFCDAWGMRAGQWKDPTTHEKVVSDKRLLSTERSLLDALLGGGYSDRIQGASLIYGGQAKDNPLNVEVVLHDGAKSVNSSYVGHYPNDPGTVGAMSAPSNHAFDFGVAGRVEYKVMGNWANYSDFTAQNVKDQLLVLGAGIDWSQGGNGDAIQASLDAQYKHPSGFTLYAAGILLSTNDAISSVSDSSGSPTSQTDWGFQVQGSYLLNPAWELFVRYSFVKLDTEVTFATGDTQDTFHEITAGVVYYLGENGSAGNRAKVTVDINWLPNGAPKKLAGLGYLGDSNGDTELVLRGQFQLAL
jgi:hypothetical protein